MEHSGNKRKKEKKVRIEGSSISIVLTAKE